MRKLSFSVFLLAWILSAYLIVYAQPPSPYLLEPCDGESVPNDVTFKWKASPGADSYTLQILDTIDQTIRFEIPTTETQHQLSSTTPLKSTPYYWRVKAAGISGESNWSDIRGFITLPVAIDSFQMMDDSDKDGIPDEIENKIKTNLKKKTLFVRPLQRVSPGSGDCIYGDCVYWNGFVGLFPDSEDGRAKIVPFENANIEVVIIGDSTNPYVPMQNCNYDPKSDPYYSPFPCTIMQVILERKVNAIGKPVTYEYDGYKGHTHIIYGINEAGKNVSTWTWAMPAWTNSNPRSGDHEYNFPMLYPNPIDRYFEEGIYTEIAAGQLPPCKANCNDCSEEQINECSYCSEELIGQDNRCTAITNCADFPEKCNQTSPMNFPDARTVLPFPRSNDETVEFNVINFDSNGKIIHVDLTNRAKTYLKKEVKAKLVVHEMVHGLLSASGENEHCENPCCIMYKYMLDWEQLSIGPFCGGGKAENCRRVCQHSPGGSQDIRHYGVVYNVIP